MDGAIPGGFQQFVAGKVKLVCPYANNFAARTMKTYSILLRPFGALYGLVTAFRNAMYDRDWLRSFAFDFPVIVVGNMQVGGTGKTPCVEYLIRTLGREYVVATLSRGYGRSTAGYLLATERSLAEDVGDEPALLKRLHPEVEVAVGENRIASIPALLTDAPDTQVIICDDAFQHRSLQAGFNLLLTGYNALYIDDVMLPAGRLREPVSGSRRAHAILVTGCPLDLPPGEQKALAARLSVRADQPVFFAGLEQGSPYRFGRPDQQLSLPADRVLLLTGIARPLRVLDSLKGSGAGAGGAVVSTEAEIKHLIFPDHHAWQARDLDRIRSAYQDLSSTGDTVIFTTEKDAVRLEGLADVLADLPIFVLPVRMVMLPDSQPQFDRMLKEFVKNAELGRPEE